MTDDLNKLYQFRTTPTAPISRSASGVSLDATTSKLEELLSRLDDALKEAKKERELDKDFVVPSEASFKQSKSFAISLSSYPFTLPLVMCLNDGGICFQWTTEKSGVLTATLYGDNAFVYVARFGPKERSTGTDEYTNESISENLLIWLKRYFIPSSQAPWKSTSTIMSH
jgi:hypothetical protein